MHSVTYPDVLASSPRRRGALRLVVTVLLLAFILHTVGVSHIVRSLSGVDPVLFASAVGVGVVGVAISSKRWQLLLEPKGLDSGFVNVFVTYYMGSFLNLYMPSTIGGDAVRGRVIAEDGDDLAGGYASVFLERLTGLIALLTIATVAMVAYPHALSRPFGIALACGLTAASVLVVVSFSGEVGPRLDRLEPIVPSKLFDLLTRLHGSVNAYGDDRDQVYKALALAFVFQFVPVATVFLLSRSIDLYVPLLFLLVMVPLSQLISLLPISIGGYGVREVVYVAFLSQVGVGPPAAVALAILVGIFTLVKNSLGAVGLLVRGVVR